MNEAFTELEKCMLTELAEQQNGISPWDCWKFDTNFGNSRMILNRLYFKGVVRVDEAGYYYSLDRDNMPDSLTVMKAEIADES